MGGGMSDTSHRVDEPQRCWKRDSAHDKRLPMTWLRSSEMSTNDKTLGADPQSPWTGVGVETDRISQAARRDLGGAVAETDCSNRNKIIEST